MRLSERGRVTGDTAADKQYLSLPLGRNGPSFAVCVEAEWLRRRPLRPRLILAAEEEGLVDRHVRAAPFVVQHTSACDDCESWRVFSRV